MLGEFRGICGGLQIFHQVPPPHPKRLCNSQKGIDRNRLYAPLKRAEVTGMQFGFLRQLFLTETRLLSIVADRFTQDAAMFWHGRHNPVNQQEYRASRQNL